MDAIAIVVLDEQQVDAERIVDAVRAACPGLPVALARGDLAQRYAEAVAAAQQRDENLARAVHALRTPLNAVLGWASILRTRRVDDETRARAVEIIERNARRQARLIDALLDRADIPLSVQGDGVGG